MHRLVGTIAIAATLVLAVGASGCGSSKSKSNSGTSTTSAARSKSECLKRGNAICRRGNKAINTTFKKAFPSRAHRPTRAQKKKVAIAVLGVTQTEIAGVRALPAPSGDEAKVRKV